MRRHNTPIAKALLVGAFCFATSSPGMPQTTLDIGAARDLAFSLVADGEFDAAASLAQTLLKRDPNDHAALLALAQAQRGAGKTGAAVKTAKAAWKAADTNPERYASATVVAQALAFDNKKLQSQFWLRRAAQAAPNAALRDTAERNFKFIRERTPLKVNLSFSVAPSSNINNGATGDTIIGNTAAGPVPITLSAADRALSGTAFQFGAVVNYNKPISQRQTLTFGGSLATYSYSLSSEAKAAIAADLDLDGFPADVSASDFAFQELRLHARTRLIDADNLGSIGGGFTIGQNWYGGNPLTQFVRADINRQTAVGETAQAGIGLSVEKRWRLDNDIRDATVWSLSGNYAMSLKNNDILSFNARLTDVSSDSSTTANHSARLGLSYRFAQPIFGNNTLQLSMGAQFTEYDRVSAANLPFSTEPRKDVKLNAAASVVIGDLDYFGFSPTATLSASQTRSNVDIYDTHNLGVSLGLKSSF